jgi:hypothetical protein
MDTDMDNTTLEAPLEELRLEEGTRERQRSEKV